MAHIVTDPQATDVLAQDTLRALRRLIDDPTTPNHYGAFFETHATSSERAVLHEKVNTLADAFVSLQVYCEAVSRVVRERMDAEARRETPAIETQGAIDRAMDEALP